MASPMASTCNHYTAGCTKTELEILQVKRGQKQRNAPGKARKRRNRMRSGCWREVQRVRTDGKTGIDRHRTCLGCRLGRFAAERHWRSLTPRHALRRAQPCLVAESLCALTKKERQADACLSFLAGAEGLSLAGRLGRFAAERHWRSLTPRHAVLEWMWKNASERGEGAVLPVFFCKTKTCGAGLVLFGSPVPKHEMKVHWKSLSE